MRRTILLLLAFLAPPACVRAGLYYSGETYAELPSHWRGFLLDQRALRQAGIAPAQGTLPSSLRTHYLQEAARLARLKTPSPDESADLGALYVRLGETAKALEVLRAAQRANPIHFRLAANLGTAWFLHGDLTQAAAALEQAVRLAPGKYVRAEQLHLKLARLRAKERPGTQTLDNLFGVRFLGPDGTYQPGKLAPAQRKALPEAALALVQQLALWLPGDARLLWQLAELAGAHGDVTTAAAIMDGCVAEFGLRDGELRTHRKQMRAAAAKVERVALKDHEEHALRFKPRSSRPLVSKTGAAVLPPVKLKGINPLPWEVISETTVDRQARPTFAKYLKELDGKQVVVRGHMQPYGEDVDLGAFLLIEHPVGCWYCEKPEVSQIVLVEMPEGKVGRFTRGRIRITGKLMLNSTDPENFLYILRDAKIAADGSE